MAKYLEGILKQEQEEREEKMFGLWMACHTHQAIAEAVGLERQTVSSFLQKMQESFHGKDGSIFRDFEGEESHLRVYSVWNFPRATNCAARRTWPGPRNCARFGFVASRNRARFRAGRFVARLGEAA